MQASLQLSRLRYKIPIGLTAQERKKAQSISISIEIRFAEIPGACKSDRLDQTIGYERIAEMVKLVVHGRIYQLIEPLGYDVFSAVKKSLPAKYLLKVSILKEKPPVDHLEDGAIFSLSDW